MHRDLGLELATGDSYEGYLSWWNAARRSWVTELWLYWKYWSSTAIVTSYVLGNLLKVKLFTCYTAQIASVFAYTQFGWHIFATGVQLCFCFLCVHEILKVDRFMVEAPRLHFNIVSRSNSHTISFHNKTCFIV